MPSGAAAASTSTSSSAARTASPRRSPSSLCWRCTGGARRPGSRRRPSARSRSQGSRNEPGAKEGAFVNDLARTIEALLFLSPQPVSAADLAEATEAKEGQVTEAIDVLREDLAAGRRGVVLREVGGGFALASDPASEAA